MKKILAMLLALGALLTGALGAAGEADGVGMANPWVETDAEGVMQMVGVEFGIPAGAENISYSVLEVESLAEMRFTWNGLEYTARIKPCAAFEDISGLYYDEWLAEDPCEIQWCEGVCRRAQDDMGTVDVCLWFDVAPGIMYSVSTSAADLDGFDIQAAAEQLFVPMQGDALGDAEQIAAALAPILTDGAGDAGTAGASLKQATVVADLIGLAANWQMAELEETVLAEGVEAALDQLDDEQKSAFAENFTALSAAADAAFADYAAVSGAYADAGVGEAMQALVEAERGDADWQALKAALEAQLGE